MCGIFGWSFTDELFNSLHPVQKIVLSSSLSALNDDRGGTSWGVCVLKDGEPEIIKGMGAISKGMPKLKYLSQNSILMAHTRFPTAGKPKIKNAHPFQEGRIIGAHNGVIQNHKHLNKKYKRSFSVDSMHIFAHINEEKSLNELHGYGTIEWIDTKFPHEINLCKLTRESYLAVGTVMYKNTEQGVIWSSVEEHLENACNLANIKMVRKNIFAGSVYRVNRGRCFEIHSRMTLASPPPKKEEEKKEEKVTPLVVDGPVTIFDPETGEWTPKIGDRPINNRSQHLHGVGEVVDCRRGDCDIPPNHKLM